MAADTREKPTAKERRPKPGQRQQEPSALDDADLAKRRGTLAFELEEAPEREDLVFALQQVEAELDGRRRVVERAEAARLEREEREREAAAAERAAKRARALEELARLGTEREEAARAIDEATTALRSAIEKWCRIGSDQARAGQPIGLDAQLVTRQGWCAGWISHQLSTSFGHATSFERSLSDHRDLPFAESDAPFGTRITDTLPRDSVQLEDS